MDGLKQQQGDALSLNERLNQHLTELIASQLNLSVNTISVHEPLVRYGANPTFALQFAYCLGKIFAGISSTFIFKNKNIQAITDYLLATQPDVALSWIENTSHVPSVAPLLFNSALNTEIHQKDDLRTTTRRYLRDLIGRALNLPPDLLKDQTPFNEYGFSTLTVESIMQELESILGELPVTMFFEHYTIDRVTDYLLKNHAPRLSEYFGATDVDNAISYIQQAPRSDEKPSSTEHTDYYSQRALPDPSSLQSTSAFDIAIIGLDGRYPGAENITEFWQNLVNNTDCITEIPPNRWDWRAYFSPEKGVQGKIYSKWGGFIHDVDCFDAHFFNLSPYQAEQMDPAERLFMQAAYRALEDAGYTRETLDRQRRVGVFVGATAEEYLPYGLGKNLGLFMNNSASLANRISYFCNFIGPSLTLNTMCSSSLSAIHFACQSLMYGECSAAIAGAVNLSIHPNKYAYLSHKQFLSSLGRCMPFSAQADGYVPGEGVGAVVLKPLVQAMADGDHIYGVIKGSALNHGGKTNGFSVPAPQSQARVIEQALHSAGIDASAISYVEAHGTGTTTGDSIEIEGLTRAFGGEAAGKQYCAVGSVKSNIGHCESAAGLAGLTKVLLQMQHGTLLKSLHSETLNPGIKFSQTPFFVQRENMPWERPLFNVNGKEQAFPRIAGLSSFGAGGSNAHMIIEEPPQQPIPETSTTGPVLIVLSAANHDRLIARVSQLVDYLNGCEVNLNDLAYTLQTGREAMAARLALVISSQSELIEKLCAVIAEDTQEVYLGNTGIPDEHAPSHESNLGELDQLAEGWVRGDAVDWRSLYLDYRPRRLSLPGYPFAREHYWLPPLAAESSGLAEHLHPLVHRNISDVHGVCFSTWLTGNEVFLRDYQVYGCAVVPAAAQLEWVAAALMLAHGVERAALTLQDIVWLRPLEVTSEREINIVLQTFENNRTAFELYGMEDTLRHVYCHGYVVISGVLPQMASHLDIASLRAKSQPIANLAEYYAKFNAQGIHYGPSLRALTALDTDGQIAVGEIDLSNCDLLPALRGIVLIDCALQACSALDEFTRLRQPLAVTQWQTSGSLPDKAFVVVRKIQEEEYNIELTNAQGHLFMQLSGVNLRLFDAQLNVPEPQLLLAVPGWHQRELSVSGAAEQQSIWTLVCDVEVAPELQEKLTADRYLCLTAQGTAAQRYVSYTGQLMQLLQNNPALLPGSTPVRIQLLLGDEGEHGLMQGLDAFLRSAEMEFAHLSVQTIVLNDTSLSGDELARILQREAQQGDPLVRYQEGHRFVLSWKEAETLVSEPVSPWRDRGVYWITGGLGGLGRQLATTIADAVHRPTLILSGRQAPTEYQRQWLDALRARGAIVECYPLDVSDSSSVTQAVSFLVAAHGGINGVLHCAGLQYDGLVHNLDESGLQEVMAAKVIGAEALDLALGDLHLDWLILCSSLTAVQGNPGQSGYAAANAYLDRLACYRQQQVERGEKYGLTISVNWPMLSDAGMLLDVAQHEALGHAFGLTPMPCAKGIAALPQVVTLGVPQIAILYGDQLRLRGWLVTNKVEEEPEYIVPLPDDKYQKVVVDYLKATLSSIIKIPFEQITDSSVLEEYGVDSAIAAEWQQILSRTFGELPDFLFFENPGIDTLTHYLLKNHANKLASLAEIPVVSPEPEIPVASYKEKEGVPVETVLPEVTDEYLPRSVLMNSHSASDIAIVGLSGRYPQADDIEQFWQNLLQGRDCITEIPAGRWDWRHDFDERRGIAGKNYSKWGGFIDGIDEFDPQFFQIRPSDAERMDPQERLFLQCVWHAIEDAGYTRDSLPIDEERLVGVFVGVMYDEYQLYTPKIGEAGTSPILQGVSASIANRVSWFCNFRGPSLAVNTMCSSSLTAIHLACQSLLQRECSVAIAGGVNINSHPNKYLAHSEMGLLSLQGHCASFAAGGNGYVPGEGVGAVVLKPLNRALADGDRIYGIIKGSAVNHGGKTHDYTVPSPLGQRRVIERAIQASGVDYRAISYLETHGTGAALGDPIEAISLTDAFAGKTNDRHFCAIGSVKSNIGHSESAAGIAGLTKILLQMQHGQFVKNLHCEDINPNIDFTDSPFFLLRENQPWLRPKIQVGNEIREYPRLAGLSAFGAGGVNGHLIVEEYIPARLPEPTIAMSVIIVLSAQTAEVLRLQARRLAEYLEQHDVNLTDVAWTLQVGREEMIYRLALVVEERETLVEKLRAISEGEQYIANTYIGELQRESSVLSVLNEDDDLQQLSTSWINKRKLDKLAELWIQGLNIDWRKLYGMQRPQRVQLPGYPFAKETYWATLRQNTTDKDTQSSAQIVKQDADSEALTVVPDVIESGPLPSESTLSLVIQDESRPGNSDREPEEQAGIVLEEQDCTSPLPYHLFVISAKTAEGLRYRIEQLDEVLTEGIWDAQTLNATSSTLLNNRQHFAHRCAMVIQSAEDARNLLQLAMQGVKHNNLFSGLVSRNFSMQKVLQAYGERLIAGLATQPSSAAVQESLLVLADMYCQGYELSWSVIFDPKRSDPLPLPVETLERKDHLPTSDNELDESFATDQQTADARQKTITLPPSKVPQVTLLPAPQLEPIAGAEQAIAFEKRLTYLVWAQLDSLGWLKDEATVTPAFHRWYQVTLAMLEARGIDLDTPAPSWSALWEQWMAERGALEANPVLSVQVKLMTTLMISLPAILRGEEQATGLTFASGQLGQLEEAYHHNIVTARFNDVLAERLEAYIKARVAREPQVRLRILEVGAGMGGTSAQVLSRITPFMSNMAEYTYTDISDFFLHYGQKNYLSQAPYLRTHKLNIEYSPQEQGIETESYDVVIAANVLHVISDLRSSLCNIRSLLKTNGLLLINDISSISMFTHLSFALLDDGWLAEEDTRSLPGVNALPPASWLQVLQEEGWRSITFPADALHEWGQQIVLAFKTDDLLAGHDFAADNVDMQDEMRVIQRPGDGTVAEDALQQLLQPIECQNVDVMPVNAEENLLPQIAVIDARENALPVAITSEEPMTDIQAASVKKVGINAQSAKRGDARDPVIQDATMSDETIAIVGISAHFAHSPDMETLWQNLKTGADCIETIPTERWSLAEGYTPDREAAITQGLSYGKWGGFIHEDEIITSSVDEDVLRLSPAQKLFVGTVKNAIASAGYDAATLALRSRLPVGVYVGEVNESGDLQTLSSMSAATTTSCIISTLFGFTGPSLSVNAHGASSLTAIHSACLSLARGECGVAIAGGVSWFDEATWRLLCRFNLMGSHADSRSFSATRDGMLFADGAGAIVLKRLSAAQRDGDNILGLIRSTVTGFVELLGERGDPVNNLANLMEENFRRSAVAPETISYVDAAAAGLRGGDALELAAMNKAFSTVTTERQFCALGAVQSSIGHAGAASGIAQLAKVILQLQHRQLTPGFCNGITLDSALNLTQSPFWVPDEITPWVRSEQPLRAMINSRGYGGFYAGAIIEGVAPPDNDDRAIAQNTQLIVLSANDEKELLAMLHQLLAFISSGNPLLLADVAYTLQTGRTAGCYRWAVAADSMDELAEILRRWLEEPKVTTYPGVVTGIVEPDCVLVNDLLDEEALRMILQRYIADGDLCRLAGWWVKGADIEWDLLHTQTPVRRVALPAAPHIV